MFKTKFERFTSNLRCSALIGITTVLKCSDDCIDAVLGEGIGKFITPFEVLLLGLGAELLAASTQLLTSQTLAQLELC